MLGLKGITKKVSNLNQMENLYHIRERFSIIHDNKIIGTQMKWEGEREKPNANASGLKYNFKKR